MPKQALRRAVAAHEQLLGDLFDLAILELPLPGMDGLELLEQMREAGVATAAIVLTAQGSVPDAVRAMKLGAIDFLEKPPQLGELRRLVEEVVGHHVEQRERVELDDYESHLQAAQRQIELRHFARAEKHLQRVLELEARSPDVLNLLGVWAELGGDRRTARTFYGRALRAKHDHKAAGQNLRRLLDLNGVDAAFTLEQKRAIHRHDLRDGYGVAHDHPKPPDLQPPFAQEPSHAKGTRLAFESDLPRGDVRESQGD